jgi:hypothetical protein
MSKVSFLNLSAIYLFIYCLVLATVYCNTGQDSSHIPDEEQTFCLNEVNPLISLHGLDELYRNEILPISAQELLNMTISAYAIKSLWRCPRLW